MRCKIGQVYTPKAMYVNELLPCKIAVVVGISELNNTVTVQLDSMHKGTYYTQYEDWFIKQFKLVDHELARIYYGH